MTYPISDVVRRAVYSGSAGTGPYSFTFEIQDETDIDVYINDTLQTLTTHYTVTINVDGTGSITLVSAASASDAVSIVGAKAIQRQTDFVTGGDLYANSLNDELDAQTIFAQQNYEALQRALKLPVSSAVDVSVVLPAPVAGYIIGWNDSANALASFAPTDSLVVVQATAPDEAVFKLWYDTSGLDFKYWDGSAWKPTSDTDKADRDTDAVTGNLAKFDADGNPVDSGIPATSVGRKNLIINGSFRINQREVTSGHTASGADEYTLDRWKITTSGQSITWTGTYSKTVTAPAGGLEQVIEGLSIVSGTYVISWTGTATCTVDAVSKSSGDTFTLTEGTDCSVIFSGGTVTDVQVEAGSVATDFEQRSYGEELALCRRYYQRFNDTQVALGKVNSSNGQSANVVFRFPGPMRVPPTFTFSGNFNQSGDSAAAIPVTNITSNSPSINSIGFVVAVGSTLGAIGTAAQITTDGTGVLKFDAEL